MLKHSLPKRYVYATTTALLLLGLGSTANAQNAPSFMGPIEGRTVSSPADTATKNVLALNSMMFELYDDAAKVFQANILKNHPVILGLFTGAGGRFILYRPGMAPLEAPSVPIVYQLLKSVGHSTMALTEIVTPYLDNPANQSWRSSMAAYRARTKAAVDGLDATPMQADWRDNSRVILENNIAFMDDCLAKGSISSAALQEFAKKQAPPAQAQHRLGGANSSRSLDEGDRGLEDDAGQRLGQGLRGQQHHLCGAAKQHPIQRVGAIFRTRSGQRQADADRDDFVHIDAG